MGVCKEKQDALLLDCLRNLLVEMSIEEILDEQNLDAEEALLALYEIGLLDLERYAMSMSFHTDEEV